MNIHREGEEKSGKIKNGMKRKRGITFKRRFTARSPMA
jgi:hypothetical protein